MQKKSIRKSCYFKTLAPKDFQAPFLCNRGPRRKPSSREDFPCMAHKFNESVFSIYIIPLSSPGEDNGIIYIAAIDSVKLYATQGKSSREEGFFQGPLLHRNGAWKSFGASVLK